MTTCMQPGLIAPQSLEYDEGRVMIGRSNSSTHVQISHGTAYHWLALRFHHFWPMIRPELLGQRLSIHRQPQPASLQLYTDRFLIPKCEQVLLQDIMVRSTFLTNFVYAIWPPSTMHGVSDLVSVLPNDIEVRVSHYKQVWAGLQWIRLAFGVLALSRKQHLQQRASASDNLELLLWDCQDHGPLKSSTAIE